MIYLQDLTRKDLAALLLAQGQAHHMEKRAALRAKQIFNWVYQRHAVDWDEMSDLAKDLREWLKANITIKKLSEQSNQQSEDGTHKFLWTLADGKTIESVIIPSALREKEGTEWEDECRFSGRRSHDGLKSENWKRLTACISSQVGCAMACKFCLTGIQGLDRGLETHEIITQVWELRRLAPITNVVFMGMGEPLHNLNNVARACEIMLDPEGLHFSKRKVTVSTSGLVPAIRELGQRIDVSLAVSLNASSDEERSAIMPVNKKWGIDELFQTLLEFPLSNHRYITLEYVLLKGHNDSKDSAERLFQRIKPHRDRFKINLIPFNEHPGSEFKRPNDMTVKSFQHALVSRGVTATVRISRGRDILAACGQLRSMFGTARGTDRHQDYA